MSYTLQDAAQHLMQAVRSNRQRERDRAEEYRRARDSTVTTREEAWRFLMVMDSADPHQMDEETRAAIEELRGVLNGEDEPTTPQPKEA